MKAWRALYHLVRADFYERVRRYSFLITLAATILAGYYLVPAPDAGYSAGILTVVRRPDQRPSGPGLYRGDIRIRRWRPATHLPA